MMNNIADIFVDSIYQIIDKPIPLRISQFIKKCLVDYLGATIGGSAISQKKGHALLALLNEKGDCTLVGYKQKASLQTALLINGISSHMAELDDGVISGIIHPGSPVFTALLSVAEKENVSWNNFAIGVLIGYEASVRLANAIQPSHKKCGYHASGTCGTIGVAMGIAAMLGFSKNQMKETLSVSTASAHGTLKVLEDASELKPYNIASAAINGVLAAYMAMAGFRGANDAFSGEAGFFAQMTQEVDYSKLIRKPDDSYCIEDVYFKPYAACRYCHPSIEASIKLRKDHNIDYRNIAKIDVVTYSLAVKHHDHVDIPNLSSAKMSIPYSAAVSLVTGSGGASSYTDKYVFDREIIGLAHKVHVSSDEEYSAQFPRKSMARMTITMNEGLVYSTIIDLPKGEPDNPLTDSDLCDKFKSLSSFAGWEDTDAQQILEIIYADDFDIQELIKKL